MNQDSVIVIGGGIAGLTISALLANEGIAVTLLESHYQTGGCAGTFKRGPYIFDVGATQVAGLEEGGIHARINKHLKISSPVAEIIDPACLVDLCDGSQPIRIWHDPKKWEEERKKNFPGSELFWQLCKFLHEINWSFTQRNPVFPTGNLWDQIQLLKAFRPANITSAFFLKLSIADLLKICGCNQDGRLKKFLDLQLKLYSQDSSEGTAALYGATVIQMAQYPRGLWHVKGSMQKLSEGLAESLCKNGGELLLGHRVIELQEDQKQNEWTIKTTLTNKSEREFKASHVICTLPPQCLTKIISQPNKTHHSFWKRIKNLPEPSGAIVFYGVIKRIALPTNCPLHIQLSLNQEESLFISISKEGDGRAPLGEATIIASMFTEINQWKSLNETDYKSLKNTYQSKILKALNDWFKFDSKDWLHQEVSTPRSFAKWTGRPNGIVGGLGQNPSNFGPFGLTSRTPLQGLWLCGDSIYPGEGTAGVSQCALMVYRQIMAEKGFESKLKNII